MYVCVYVVQSSVWVYMLALCCICICIRACMHSCHVRTYIYQYACIYTCTVVHVNIDLYMCAWDDCVL